MPPPLPLGREKLPLSRNTTRAPDSRHSAKACPLGRAKLLLSRTPTAHLIPTARREPRPPKIQSYGSAGASPSQNTTLRLGGGLALPKYNRTARREPRPPKIQSYGSAGASPSQNTIPRLGGSLALPKYNPTARQEPRPPKIQSYGSAGASPSRNTIVRLGRSLALPKYNRTARQEPRPPEIQSHGWVGFSPGTSLRSRGFSPGKRDVLPQIDPGLISRILTGEPCRTGPIDWRILCRKFFCGSWLDLLPGLGQVGRSGATSWGLTGVNAPFF